MDRHFKRYFSRRFRELPAAGAAGAAARAAGARCEGRRWDRLGAFVVPYQHALETETGQHHMHLSLQGLLSHVPRKNAEDIANV